MIAAQASKYKTGAVWSHCPIFPLMLNIIQCSWGVLQRRLQTILVPRRFCCVPARKDWAGLQTEPFLSASAGISLLALGYLAAPASMGRCCHACDASPTLGLRPFVEQGTRSPKHSHTRALLCPSLSALTALCDSLIKLSPSGISAICPTGPGSHPWELPKPHRSQRQVWS